MTLKSALDAIKWPAFQGGRAAELMSLQRQYDSTQYWSSDEIKDAQWKQLSVLVEHAAKIPFYADRLKSVGIVPNLPIDPAAWLRLPTLTRKDVQTLGDSLHAVNLSSAFGDTNIIASGGSSGIPVRIKKSGLDSLVWESLNIREELWHRPTFDGTIVRLRGVPDGIPRDVVNAINSRQGVVLPDWGRPANLVWHTGKMGLMNPKQPIEYQIEFIQRLNASYIFTFPSHLQLLLSYCAENKIKLPSVRSVWTASELVNESLRMRCMEILNCKIIDNYSSAETGYLALQCPQHYHYHVQSEAVLLEILDEHNNPCAIGQTGKVVVTPLHNFAMPLLRYELGDESMFGEPCSCRRGLPTLKSIIGRTGDYLISRSGHKRRVDINHYSMSSITAVKEYQIVQESYDQLELKVAVSRPLTIQEDAKIKRCAELLARNEFDISVTYHNELPRTAAGKLRPFISKI